MTARRRDTLRDAVMAYYRAVDEDRIEDLLDVFTDFYRFDPTGRAAERRTYFDAPSV